MIKCAQKLFWFVPQCGFTGRASNLVAGLQPSDLLFKLMEAARTSERPSGFVFIHEASCVSDPNIDPGDRDISTGYCADRLRGPTPNNRLYNELTPRNAAWSEEIADSFGCASMLVSALAAGFSIPETCIKLEIRMHHVTDGTRH